MQKLLFYIRLKCFDDKELLQKEKMLHNMNRILLLYVYKLIHQMLSREISADGMNFSIK